MVRRLLYLNGIAIFFVVLYHSVSWGSTAMFAWTPRYLPVAAPVFDQTGSVAYYWIRFAEQIVSVAVPAFMFVSGYFIAFTTGHRSNLTWEQVWARIRSLLIPYTIWSVLIWISFYVLLGDMYTPGEYAVHFLIGSTNNTFYYVPLLIQLYILAPLLIPFAKDKWVILLVVTGTFQLIYQVGIGMELMYGYDNIPRLMGWLAWMPKWLFLSRLFWFVLGMIFGFHITLYKQFLERFKWVFLIITIACIPLGMLEWEAIFHFSGRDYLNMRETVLDGIYSLAFIFSLLAFTNEPLPWNKRVSDLGVKSYGVYLTHYTAQEFLAKAVYWFMPALLGIQIFFQPIIIVAGLLLPLLLISLVEKTSMRKYYNYLFG
jgi:hypothetical protein